MISKGLDELGPTIAMRRLGLAGAGAMVAGLLAPQAVLAQAQGWSPPPISPMSSFLESQQSPAPVPPLYGSGTNTGADGSECLYARMLSGVVASDDRRVILRFGADAFYRVRLTKACPALVTRGANVAGVTRSTGGMICNPFDIQLKIVGGDGSVSHCAGATLDRMTTAQVRAVSETAGP